MADIFDEMRVHVGTSSKAQARRFLSLEKTETLHDAAERRAEISNGRSPPQGISAQNGESVESEIEQMFPRLARWEATALCNSSAIDHERVLPKNRDQKKPRETSAQKSAVLALNSTFLE